MVLAHFKGVHDFANERPAVNWEHGTSSKKWKRGLVPGLVHELIISCQLCARNAFVSARAQKENADKASGSHFLAALTVYLTILNHIASGRAKCIDSNADRR